tara:strand:+ start:2841 stop:3635 length:795 start_codon:yes stop_codon:yes gene_type:complete
MPKKGEDRKFNANGQNGWSDMSDHVALRKGLYMDFYHTPSRNSIAFKAFITDYSETYEVNYDEQDAHGRMDPFSSYKNTQRRISLGWDVVASSFEEAKENMQRCSELVQMMYPSCENKILPDGTPNPVISEEPLFRVRFSNWLVDSGKGSFEGPGGFEVADTSGLFCRITNFQFSPDLDAGSFDTKDGVFPKSIKLSCAIVPFMPEGFWDKDTRNKKGQFKFFPFGYDGMPTLPSPSTPSSVDSDDSNGDIQSQVAANTILSGD